MNTFTKTLVLGAFVAAVGGGLGAKAQTPGQGSPAPVTQEPGRPGMMGMHGWHHGPHFGDPAAHLAALKTQIGIRPDQTAAWDAYAKVVLDTAAQRQATRAAAEKTATQALSPKDQATFLLNRMEERDQAHARTKAAAMTLLASLDDTQKVVALTQLPGLGMHGGRHHGGAPGFGREGAMMRGAPQNGGR